MEFAVPCYRCGACQTDPARGASPWRRAVRADEQVLVCPECHETPLWLDDVDACPDGGSHALTRRLGTAVCSDCGGGVTGVADNRPMSEGAEGEFSREVAEAIDRVLGRSRAVISSRPQDHQTGHTGESTGVSGGTRVS